ncbi:MAG: TlyA family RNA methyltransferase [Hominisplanchenecus sp.]
MKERLDVLLVKRNLAASREKAKAIIMSGNVFVDGQREDKAGSMFQDTVQIEVKGSTLKYVSRGGLKLEKAMSHFDLTLDGKVCMDVGSSTGGFTDCMLQNGAVKVYAVDVGHGQLDWKLRQDERVVCMEKTNIRYVTPEDIREPAAFSSIDVSFISLTKVLLPVRNLLTEDGEIVCLIKPQFEAGREKVGKKGVVRDSRVHEEVIRKVLEYAKSISFEALHLEFSPIKGPEGNIEYLLHLKKREEGTIWEAVPFSIEETVAAAHEKLDKTQVM